METATTLNSSLLVVLVLRVFGHSARFKNLWSFTHGCVGRCARFLSHGSFRGLAVALGLAVLRSVLCVLQYFTRVSRGCADGSVCVFVDFTKALLY